MSPSPRVRIIYLVAVAIGVFFTHDLRILGGVLAIQIALWTGAGYPPFEALRLLRKLAVFMTFVMLSFIFFPDGTHDARWRELGFGGFSFSLSIAGLEDGAIMCLRIFIAIYTSMLVRRGIGAGQFVEGLRGVFLPKPVAYALDATLHLVEPEKLERAERGSGMGGGGGKGRNRKGPGHLLKDVLKGDVSFFMDGIAENLAKGRAYAEANYKGLTKEYAADIGVISGMTLAMLSIKWIKVLPGIPFAPGYKGVLLMPLYILAAELTHTRWGATITGASMGVVSFLMGDGRYGIFEILKHIAPGLIFDLLLPFIRVKDSRIPGAVRYGVAGFLAGLGRFATIVAITLIMGAPDAFYAFAAPLALLHLGFGAASGLVTFPLMKSLKVFRISAGIEASAETQAIASEPPGNLTVDTKAAGAPEKVSDTPRSAGSGGGRGMGGGRGRGRVQ